MKSIGWAILLLLIGGVIGYFIRCPKVKRVEVPGPTKIVPKIVYRDSIEVREIPAKIDTQEVISDYYTKRPIVFQDTAQEVSIKFEGILFENRLIAPELTLHNFRQPVVSSPWGVWVDAEVGFNSFEFGASVTKGANRFSADYDIITGVWGVGYSRRLFSF